MDWKNWLKQPRRWGWRFTMSTIPPTHKVVSCKKKCKFYVKVNFAWGCFPFKKCKSVTDEKPVRYCKINCTNELMQWLLIVIPKLNFRSPDGYNMTEFIYIWNKREIEHDRKSLLKLLLERNFDLMFFLIGIRCYTLDKHISKILIQRSWGVLFYITSPAALKGCWQSFKPVGQIL